MGVNMSESIHISEAMVTCSISDYGDLTLEVLIPSGKLGYPGFVIHNGKVVQGSIPWRSLR